MLSQIGWFRIVLLEPTYNYELIPKMTHIEWLSMVWVSPPKNGHNLLKFWAQTCAKKTPEVLCEVGFWSPFAQPGVGRSGRGSARAVLEPLGSRGREAVRMEISPSWCMGSWPKKDMNFKWANPPRERSVIWLKKKQADDVFRYIFGPLMV